MQEFEVRQTISPVRLPLHIYRRLVATVLLTALVMVPGAAASEPYEVCTVSSVQGAHFESQWDCGGLRGRGKTFDYLVTALDADDEHASYIRRVDLPDESFVAFAASRYAWGTNVGENRPYAGRYVKWTLIDDASLRCWDLLSRFPYAIEIDPSACE